MKLISESNGHVYLGSNDKIISFSTYSTKLNEFISPDSNGSNIVLVEAHPFGKYVAAAYSNKKLCIWDTKTGLFQGSVLSKKRITCLTFGTFMNNGQTYEVLIFADKFGEIWSIDVPNLSHEPVLCGAHVTSLVSDMLLHDNSFITCDRDEKIRITNFPKLLIIDNYCLGHTNVVASLSLVKNFEETFLLSSSWDNRIILWNYKTGNLLSEYNLMTSNDKIEVETGDIEVVETNEEVKDEEDENEDKKEYNEEIAGNYPFKIISLPSLSSDKSLFAVIQKNLNELKLFSIENLTNNPNIQLLQQILLPAVPCDIVVHNQNIIIVLPAPYYVFVVDCINFNEQNIENINLLKQYCELNKVNYSQQFIGSSDDDINGGKFSHEKHL